jgi:hypothetical protein
MPVTMPDPHIACSLLSATPGWPASVLAEETRLYSGGERLPADLACLRGWAGVKDGVDGSADQSQQHAPFRGEDDGVIGIGSRADDPVRLRDGVSRGLGEQLLPTPT